MNKQEAIKRVEGLLGYGSRAKVVTDIISQIHEPQTVVLPKEVAEWIESIKSVGWSFKVALNNTTGSVDEWLANRDNQETFARAWLNGFEIEQEKLYTVEIPNPNRTTEPIIYLSRDEGGKIFLNNWFLHISQNWKNQPHARLTEAEIKEDFEWAWQFREEVD